MPKAKFKIEKGEVEGGKPGRASVHEFPWDDLARRPGHNFFVPSDYWNMKRYDSRKARERIRAHFRYWQSRSRKKFTLLMAAEPAGIRVGIKAK